MSRYICSDLHMGHNNIGKFRGMGMTSEEHWDAALEGLKKIPKRDTIFFLGDIALTPEWLLQVARLPCQNKILLLGNHDCYEGRGVTIKHLSEAYDKVMSLRSYKKHWLSHAPIHPKELRGKRNCHGHTHPCLMLGEDGLPDNRYVNCCVEYTGYDPITWEYAISDEYQQECLKKWGK